MNECLLFLHTSCVVLAVLCSLRWGKGGLWMIHSLLTVLANLFVVKQVSLFSFSVTCSDAYAVGAVASLNLVQEYFGQGEAKKSLYLSFFSLVVFGCMAQLHLLYSPALCDGSQKAFETIFAPTWRLVFASFAAFFLSQRWDLWFFGKLKELPSLPLWLRLPLSLGVSQLIDTCLFTFLGLYGVVSSLGDVILMSFLIKCMTIVLSAPLASFSKRFIQVAP